MAQPSQLPPQNPKPRRIAPCHRHPNLATTTGLCAPCLHERLSLLNSSTSSSNATSAAAASASASASSAELRRCKTFSANNCDVVLGVEPRRRSCDVRGRNSTLSSLFNLDDNDGVVSVQSKKLGFLSKGGCPVLEEEEIVEEIGNEIAIAIESKVTVSIFGNVDVRDDDDDGDEFEDSRTMKEFIDLEFQASSSNSKNSDNNRKDFKDIAGSFRIAASVFGKKFRKWGKKERIRENEWRESSAGGSGNGGGNLGEMKIESLRGRRLRGKQSEVGEYGFRRRSCDTDPRGSIDFGRASNDCGGLGRRSCDADFRGLNQCGGFGRRSCDTDPRGSIECGGLRSRDTDPRGTTDCGGLGRRWCDTDPRAAIECAGLGRRSCNKDPRGPIDCGGLGRRSCDADPRGPIDCEGLGRRSCDTDPRDPIECGGLGRKSCDTDPRGPIDCGGLGRRSCDADPRGSVDLGRASIEYGGHGRKSCDSDPRFSIDLGRASVDCGWISVDEVGRSEFDAPRASWDGYLLGGRATLPRGNVNVPMPVVSVIENAMATVYGFDNQFLSEGKMNLENGVKRDTGMIEDGEAKGLSNARISAAAIGIFNGTKLLITEKELNEWRLNSNLIKDDNSSESFETASKDLASVFSSSNGKEFKKCRQWSKLWSIWGLLNRKKGDKSENQEIERDNSDSPGARKLTQTQSSSSSRNESKAIVRSKQEPVVLQKNRSARYSPNHLDNGLLRFYLTPLRSGRRNRLGKSRVKNSKSLARSVLRL